MDLFKAFHQVARALNPFGVSVTSTVKGFHATLEKMDGALLTERGARKPASENHYYVVSVISDGANPDYPAMDKPEKYHFTVGLQGTGTGFTNGVCFAPAGSKFTGFRLTEELDDGRNTIGHRLASHHAVGINAIYKTEDGRTNFMRIGGWVRKSDRESPAYQSSLQNRVEYF